MTKDSSLYYIALIPPKPIREDVLGFQAIAEKKFSSKITLRSPAHITLIPPFEATSDELNKISKKITVCIRDNHRPIDTMITGFYHFSNRTILLEVSKSKKLEVLFNDLMLVTSEITFNQSYVKFIPHITIANRDLSPEIFDKAYDYFNHIPYSRNFICEEIALFIFKEGKWSVVKRFDL